MNKINKQFGLAIIVFVSCFIAVMISGIVYAMSAPRSFSGTRNLSLLGLNIIKLVGNDKGFELSTGAGVFLIPFIVTILIVLISLVVKKISKINDIEV